MPLTAYPGDDLIDDPLIQLTYTIEIDAASEYTWPWLVQMGYHRGGWYIDTWWDRFAQTYVWPRLVPKEARGTYAPAAEAILPQFQGLQVGDIVPDGPPGTAYYDVVGLEENRFLLLHSTSHFKYMAPAFLAGTRLEPHGAFSWAFALEEIQDGRTRLISRWRGKAGPALLMLPWLPVVRIADHFHQKEILKGVKRRAERGTNGSNTEETGRSISVPGTGRCDPAESEA